jgi:hypothetical protein
MMDLFTFQSTSDYYSGIDASATNQTLKL